MPYERKYIFNGNQIEDLIRLANTKFYFSKILLGKNGITFMAPYYDVEPVFFLQAEKVFINQGESEKTISVTDEFLDTIKQALSHIPIKLIKNGPLIFKLKKDKLIVTIGDIITEVPTKPSDMLDIPFPTKYNLYLMDELVWKMLKDVTQMLLLGSQVKFLVSSSLHLTLIPEELNILFKEKMIEDMLFFEYISKQGKRFQLTKLLVSPEIVVAQGPNLSIVYVENDKREAEQNG